MRTLILMLVALVACQSSDHRAEQQPQHPPAHMVKVRPAKLDPNAPVVIGLHGLGGNAQHFSEAFAGANLPDEVVFLDGPIQYGRGAAWFDWPPNTSDDQLADLVDAAEQKLWPEIVEIAAGRRVIVMGFSQGAVMTYALAAKHPEIAYAFPIAGRLPAKLAPKGRAAPIYAFHGVDDPVVEIDYGRSAIAAFTAAGGPAHLAEFPDTEHTISPEIRAALLAQIRAVK